MVRIRYTIVSSLLGHFLAFSWTHSSLSPLCLTSLKVSLFQLISLFALFLLSLENLVNLLHILDGDLNVPAF
jgi:hypothetical protein